MIGTFLKSLRLHDKNGNAWMHLHKHQKDKS